MADYGDQIIIDTAQEIPELEANKNNFPQKLSSITGSIPNKAEPISFGKYITKFDRLQETTPSGPSDITPSMVKTEALDPELSEIGWRRLNFPCCTGYSPKRYKKGLDLIIHKYPNS